MLQLPDQPFLRELYNQWLINPNLMFIRDAQTGQEYTLDDLLRDVIQTRDQIVVGCSAGIKAKLLGSDTDVFVAILANPGYRFVVLFLAIFSLGAVSVPLSPVIHPDEAKYFLSLCQATLLVTSSAHEGQAREILCGTSIEAIIPREPNECEKFNAMDLSGPSEIDPERGASLIFTSGTTGKPKGVLHSRRAIYDQAKAQCQFYDFSSNDLYPIIGPMHWVGGFGMVVFCLYGVMPMEIATPVYNPEWFWNRVQKQDLTALVSPSHIFIHLEKWFREKHSLWTEMEIAAIRAGVRKFRVLNAGALPTPARTKAFWADMRGGVPLSIDYGLSEAMLLVTATKEPGEKSAPSHFAGIPISDQSKIRLDEKGEILLKTPGMLTRYISEDPDATKKAFDSEGYFRTGDVGRLDGDNLYVLGRMSSDVIRLHGLNIFLSEVEEAILQLDHIAQAWVVGVSDQNFDKRVAALVSMKDGHKCNFSAFRAELADLHSMSAHKIPTLLRILRQGEVVPMTKTGKPAKYLIVEKFFGEKDIESGVVEVWDPTFVANGEGARPFDRDSIV